MKSGVVCLFVCLFVVVCLCVCLFVCLFVRLCVRILGGRKQVFVSVGKFGVNVCSCRLDM